jgi:hypothetical protein
MARLTESEILHDLVIKLSPFNRKILLLYLNWLLIRQRVRQWKIAWGIDCF